MSTLPSIKGSVFAGHFEVLSKLVECGEISREALEDHLPPKDLALFDTPILVTAWYDIRSYTRILELLRDVAGEGSNDYLVERGAASAERLLYSGLYAQFEYLKRTQMQAASTARDRYLAFGRDLRLLATFSGSILNFSRWKSKPDPEEAGRYVIEVSEARHMPDVLCWRSDGLINEMATQHGEPDLWRWERVKDDLVVFRMVRSL